MPVGKKRASLRESDLYAPVRDHLTALGYTVRGEVEDCDVAAVRGDEVVVVELKRSLNVDLLIQATQRQAAADAVYVAIPRPAKMGRGGHWRGAKRLLRRLELGLIVVSFVRKKAQVQVVHHPVPVNRRKDRAAKGVIIREIGGRSGDYNEGGTSGRKLVTAYRESALFIACCLDRFGEMSPKDLRGLGNGAKTQSILYHNVYEWFDRIDRGLYGLSAKGRAALKEYAGVVEAFSEKIGVADADRVA